MEEYFMKLRAGQQVASAVDTTTMIVVKAPNEDVELTCGGVEMVDPKSPSRTLDGAAAANGGGTLLGKRYSDDAIGIELLCTKGGPGTVEVNGTALPLKTSKPLPASD
jgi:hypothetical protein